VGVNSLRADRLSAVVPRILNKNKLSFLDGFCISAKASGTSQSYGRGNPSGLDSFKS